MLKRFGRAYCTACCTCVFLLTVAIRCKRIEVNNFNRQNRISNSDMIKTAVNIKNNSCHYANNNDNAVIVEFKSTSLMKDNVIV